MPLPDTGPTVDLESGRCLVKRRILIAVLIVAAVSVTASVGVGFETRGDVDGNTLASVPSIGAPSRARPSPEYARAGVLARVAFSSNWAGYSIGGPRFASAVGSWTQPETDCDDGPGDAGRQTALWVGVGGMSTSSNSLEQTGTVSECVDGKTRYGAWYELVPAPSVPISLKLDAGDRIAGAVQVHGTEVTVELKNESTGEGFSKTLSMATRDLSSAEWVVEAPTSATGSKIARLAEFTPARFTHAKATTTTGHTGGIADPAWTATRLQLTPNGGNIGKVAAAEPVWANGHSFAVVNVSSATAASKILPSLADPDNDDDSRPGVCSAAADSMHLSCLPPP
jgi:hypothetical protein